MTTTQDRRDVRITVADLAGAQAKVALPGVAVFELATLPLPADCRTAAAAVAPVTQGCGSTACSPSCSSCGSL
ncbi:MAG TPA: hypothetical protein VGS19_20530 [Streptosporangiaceae bacterium]|nr:hypothetical protein [Streptosporangiaceae bacterium]